jgi:hypothetical protein
VNNGEVIELVIKGLQGSADGVLALQCYAAAVKFLAVTEATQAPAPSSSAAWGVWRRGVVLHPWSQFGLATHNTPPAPGRRPTGRLG